MRALVVSDSHGAIELLTPIINANIGSVEHVIHLGDGCGDTASFSHRHPGVLFHVVSGNCDFSANYPEKLLVTIGGKTIYVTHGHLYGVKTSYDRICYAALEAGADFCLFGHTHVPVIFEHSGVGFMNPGAVLQGNNKRPNYGIIDFTNEPLTLETSLMIYPCTQTRNQK